MSQSQRELRSTAAQEFMESLNQLEMQLKAAELEVAQTEQLAVSEGEIEKATAEAKAFAEAAADIEQFMQARNTKAQNTKS